MPTHDWSRVEAGNFHDFHHAWICETSRAMNRALFPPDYYALMTRSAHLPGSLELDVPSLDRPSNSAVVRHTSDHRVIAVVEIVSPSNKSTWNAMRHFVEKAVELLRAGIHLFIVDLFA